MKVYRDSRDEPYGAVDWAEHELNQKLFPVHRLDRDTEGLLVIAKNSDAARRLQQGFRTREQHKTYLAWVWGSPPAKLTIETPLRKHKGSGMEPAWTRFARVKQIELPGTNSSSNPAATPTALLRLELRTGRFHQIRRHLSQSGWPIVGDREYGNRGLDSAYSTKRLELYATGIAFEHPRTGVLKKFECRPEGLHDLSGRLQRGLGKPPESTENS